MNIKDAYALYCTRLDEKNAERRGYGVDVARPISLREFYRRFKVRLDEGTTARLYGKRFAQSRFQPVGQPITAERPGELVMIDHTRVDVMTIDLETGLSAGCPWLAVAMDVHTRAICAWELTFTPPSLETLTALMRQFGRGWPAELELSSTAEVPAFAPIGLPRQIIVDNALENVGRSFPASCELNGIDLVFAPVRRPQAKGQVERFFKTLNEGLFHGLPGGKPFTPQERNKRDIDPEKLARLDIGQLRAELAQFIALEYHNRVHSALGRSPRSLWIEASRTTPPFIPPCLDQYEASLGVEVDRHLSVKGIELLSLRFNGSSVNALLGDLLPRAPGRAGERSVPVKVRYLPDDLSRIFVLNTVTSRFVEIPRVEDGYPDGIGKYLLDELRKQARAEAGDEIGEKELQRAAVARLERLEEMRRDKRLSYRTKSHRLRGAGEKRPSDQARTDDRAGNTTPRLAPISPPEAAGCVTLSENELGTHAEDAGRTGRSTPSKKSGWAERAKVNLSEPERDDIADLFQQRRSRGNDD